MFLYAYYVLFVLMQSFNRIVAAWKLSYLLIFTYQRFSIDA